MTSIRNPLAAALIVGLVLPATAAAQNYRFDLGINGGGSWLTSGLDEDHLGTDAEVGFEGGWLTGAQATFWFMPRLGIRANFGFADRALEFDGERDLIGDADDRQLIDNVNLWSGTGDVMFRFAGTPKATYQGPEFMPFLALGLGAKWINPAGEGVTLVGDDDNGSVFTVGDDSYFVPEKSTLLGRVAVGTDIGVSPMLAFRLEAGDMMWDAPFQRVEATDGGFRRIDDEDVGNTQHELYATAGLHLLLGRDRGERVAALPAPPPPSAPPAAPEPAPEPVEETVSVCVIDPSTQNGVTTLNAVYMPATGDTLIDQNGERVALTEYQTSVRVAADEDWYRTGRPFTITYGNKTAEFIAYGADRPIQDNLVVLGTVDGLPVYADADAASSFRTAAGASLTPDTDLEQLLTDNPELGTQFEEIDVIYVPAKPVGCVFGPLQRAEDVRK